MLHDFNSFNVEDLHTVDHGIIDHILPLLTNSSLAHAWGVLIGHFVGVDHVGHRVGPDYPTMLAKQQHMNNVLKRVVMLLIRTLHYLSSGTTRWIAKVTTVASESLPASGFRKVPPYPPRMCQHPIFLTKHSPANHLHTVRYSRLI